MGADLAHFQNSLPVLGQNVLIVKKLLPCVT